MIQGQKGLWRLPRMRSKLWFFKNSPSHHHHPRPPAPWRWRCVPGLRPPAWARAWRLRAEHRADHRDRAQCPDHPVDRSRCDRPSHPRRTRRGLVWRLARRPTEPRGSTEGRRMRPNDLSHIAVPGESLLDRRSPMTTMPVPELMSTAMSASVWSTMR